MVMMPSREPSRKRTKDARHGVTASIKRLLVSIVFWWYLALRPAKRKAHNHHRGPFVGKLEPAGKAITSAAAHAQELCDACHATEAKFRVLISRDNDLFLCGHHFRKHRLSIGMHGYEVREL
jgi:hypothetical protein